MSNHLIRLALAQSADADAAHDGTFESDCPRCVRYASEWGVDISR